MAKTKVGSPASQAKSPQQIKDMTAAQDVWKDALLGTKTLNFDTDSENIKPSAIRDNAIPFDRDTGIISNSPEVLYFSTFEPSYTDGGRLTKFGEILQAKQESLLVSADRALSDLLNSALFSNIQEVATTNRDALKDFCESFTFDAFSLISEMDNVNKNLDPRLAKIFPYDDKGKDDMSAAVKLYGSIPEWPFSISKFLGDEDTINLWTSTKLWIQICKELKEVLSKGSTTRLLSNSTAIKPNKSSSYKNPYKIVSSPSKNISKFNWNRKTYLVPPVEKITTLSADDFENAVATYKNLFSKNIFSKKISSDSDDIDEAIARVAYVLCKEHTYSTKLIKNSSLLSQYGYSFEGRDNATNIWDYIVGTAGIDITDISSAPFGNGNSLISIAQSTEGNAEVLTFEDRYIVDDVGLKRQGAVITPGSHYYVESALNATATGFDTARLDTLLSKLSISENAFKSILDGAIFKADPYPIGETAAKLAKNKNQSEQKILEEAAKSRAVSIAKYATPPPDAAISTGLVPMLSNPISLIRKIENVVLLDSPLLNKGVTTTKEFNTSLGKVSAFTSVNLLWSRNIDAAGGMTNSEKEPTDVSWLLVSLAIDDPSLKTLLFMRQAALAMNQLDTSVGTKEVQEYTGSEFGIDEETGEVVSNPTETVTYDVTLRSLLGESILKRVKEILKPVDVTDESNFRYEKLEDAVMGTQKNGMTMLDNISSLIKQIVNVSWFRETSENKTTLYSGIPQSGYVAAFFELCMLMIHGANPERLFVSSSYAGYFVTKKLFNHIVTATKPPGSEDIITVYKHDLLMTSVENLIYEQIMTVRKSVKLMYGLLVNLKKQFSEYKNSLTSGKFTSFLSTVNGVLGDPSMTKYLLTRQQLTLVSRKLLEVAQRSSSNYSSPLKDVKPYFLNTKDNPDFDLLIPIEDIHMNSWNFWLKDFFSQSRFRQSEGFNKKIMSIGIPQKLQGRLQISASNIKGEIKKNSLIKLKVYRYDMLRPDLVHNPLTFIYDYRIFPKRILEPYVSGESPSASIEQNQQSQQLNLDNLKLYFNSLKAFHAKRYENLPQSDVNRMINNHYESFVLEMYLQFVSDSFFDEQKYYRYNQLEILPGLERLKKGNISQLSNVSSRPPFVKFFANQTFMADLDSIKKSLIMPKKFDRVFHVIIDPDDFTIDTNLTTPRVIQKYLSKRDIRSINSSNQQAITYKRRVIDLNEITFDKYFVSIESYGENTTGA